MRRRREREIASEYVERLNVRTPIVGTVLAVLLVGVLNNGMNLLGVGTFYQRVALGVLLIAAVALAQWRQARAERARTRTAAAA